MALRSKAASKTEYDSRPFIKSNLAGRSFCLGVMPIPCPHFKITIVKRSQGQSAVAGAAYQSGERLFSEYDQKTKFYNKKKELVHAEIMLPSYAPPGFADRQILWNAVEAVENQWNSQLARRIVLAFPVEVPKEQYLSMIKEFCQEQFVSKGMIADFAIHMKQSSHKTVGRTCSESFTAVPVVLCAIRPTTTISSKASSAVQTAAERC